MARKSLSELREEMRAVAAGEHFPSLQLLARYRLIQLVREVREVRAEPIARAVGVDLATGPYEKEAAA